VSATTAAVSITTAVVSITVLLSLSLLFDALQDLITIIKRIIPKIHPPQLMSFEFDFGGL